MDNWVSLITLTPCFWDVRGKQSCHKRHKEHDNCIQKGPPSGIKTQDLLALTKQSKWVKQHARSPTWIMVQIKGGRHQNKQMRCVYKIRSVLFTLLHFLYKPPRWCANLSYSTQVGKRQTKDVERKRGGDPHFSKQIRERNSCWENIEFLLSLHNKHSTDSFIWKVCYLL